MGGEEVSVTAGEPGTQSQIVDLNGKDGCLVELLEKRKAVGGTNTREWDAGVGILGRIRDGGTEETGSNGSPVAELCQLVGKDKFLPCDVVEIGSRRETVSPISEGDVGNEPFFYGRVVVEEVKEIAVEREEVYGEEEEAFFVGEGEQVPHDIIGQRVALRHVGDDEKELRLGEVFPAVGSGQLALMGADGDLDFFHLDRYDRGDRYHRGSGGVPVVGMIHAEGFLNHELEPPADIVSGTVGKRLAVDIGELDRGQDVVGDVKLNTAKDVEADGFAVGECGGDVVPVVASVILGDDDGKGAEEMAVGGLPVDVDGAVLHDERWIVYLGTEAGEELVELAAEEVAVGGGV
jgi:hypothetical protein